MSLILIVFKLFWLIRTGNDAEWQDDFSTGERTAPRLSVSDVHCMTFNAPDH